MPDISQPICFNEAVRIQKRIKLHRRCLERLMNRAAGLHLDYAEDALDDALSYLSDADDAMQRALDDPMGRAA